MIRRGLLLALLLSVLLGGCNAVELFVPTAESTGGGPLITGDPNAITPTPFQPQQPTDEPPTPAPPPTADVPLYYLPAYLPPYFVGQVNLPQGAQPTADPALGRASLDVLPPEISAAVPVGDWVYALVTPFPTLTDGVSFEELLGAWQGQSPASFNGRPLMMDASTLGVFSAVWGTPAEGAVQEVESSILLQTAWDQRPAWAIVPFEVLEPRWKVLSIDGQSPLLETFDASLYPLSVSFGWRGELSLIPPVDPATRLTNRHADRLTTVAMTGVTALVRATAETMRRKGVLYPGEDIRNWMLEADIAHVSNEIPFDPACPPPNPNQETLVFCSDPGYLELLLDIGTDVIELTGDHFADFGAEAMIYTLDLYRQNNLPYYGGGYNQADGQKALLIEHNGNKLAFIGCNGKGGGYASGRGDNPGAVPCDWDYLTGEIARLRSEGYLPIVTFQHFEYYTYVPQPNMVADFERVAGAGAVIVSGSQAHQPHGFGFYEDAFMHYGLGNLFFDQYLISLATQQGFIDRHVFYDGRHISTELLTIRFIDFARPRPMTTDERNELLNSVFSASGW